jgi:hypothetical protein
MCIVLRCYSKNPGATPLICQRIVQSYTTWSSISITAAGLSPSLMLLPFYAVTDGQPRPVNELGMRTTKGGTVAQIWTTPAMVPSTIVYSVALYNVGAPTTSV